MKKRLLFVLDSLTLGGVTSVLINLLNHLDHEAYEVDLLILHDPGDISVCLDERIGILRGDATYRYVDQSLGQILSRRDLGALLGKLKLVFLLKTGWIRGVVRRSRRKLLAKSYDTEIAFNDGFTQLFVSFGQTPRKIAWAHTDISVRNPSRRYGAQMKKALEGMQTIACVSEGVKQAYEKVYGLQRLCVIHNLLDTDAIREKSREEYSSPYRSDTVNLISVGRLCEAKCYPRLIRTHRRLVEQGYALHTYVVGDGLDKQALERQIEESGVGDSFTLLGRKDNPFPYVKDADLFVLSSVYEGLPTVLYEALILGVPCVSTRVAGAEEILGTEYGLVTDNDDESFYLGLKSLLDADGGKKYRDNLAEYRPDTSQTLRQLKTIL